MTIRKNLGEKSIRQIEKRLFEKYGLSLTPGIEQFQKIDAILREFFGAGTDGLEQKFLENICVIKTKSKEGNWFTIKDESISTTILESYGDAEKASIIKSVSDSSKVISEILQQCTIPQTSGYRKINQLIKNGLLVSHDHVISHDGKKINKYASLFDNVKIDIVKNQITVNVQLSKLNFSQSSILRIIYEES